VVNWMLISGAVCFIIWRFYEAFYDPHKLGTNAKAILLRTGAAFSSVADAFIALSIFQAIFSKQKAPVTGEPVQQQNMVGDLLKTEWGLVAVYVSAFIFLLTALVLAFYGLSKRFTESINVTGFTRGWILVTHGLAYFGYLSRAVLLAIIGFFFLKAAVEHNARYVVNTDKAFDFIGDHIGHGAFLIVAAGTISYALYMFVLGVNYDTDGGKK
jgi:hypothetical protein